MKRKIIAAKSALVFAAEKKPTSHHSTVQYLADIEMASPDYDSFDYEKGWSLMWKKLLYGLLVYILGHIVVMASVSIYNNDTGDRSFLRAIVAAILYLAAVISVTRNRSS
ncbi:MAG TPA: hypothetical protein DEP07_26900 [Brevibacillus sp.]|nr:hypothetical protein [Brevibacillus sp.]